jgi:hypothetical protein
VDGERGRWRGGGVFSDGGGVEQRLGCSAVVSVGGRYAGVSVVRGGSVGRW